MSKRKTAVLEDTGERNLEVVLKPIAKQIIAIQITGDTGLITHKWSEKAKKQMLEKQQLKKPKKEIRDPQREYEESLYVMKDGSYGFPAIGIKGAITAMAHKDSGIEKTLVRKAIFVHGTPDNEGNLLVKINGEPRMREDMVKIGMGTSDLRYRPEFMPWSMKLELTYDADLILPETILNLLDHAGFSVGLGEWRPERDGQNGMFHVRRGD